MSSTSSRTSPSSSTSDAPSPHATARPPRVATRALGLLRLVHPFPSILDGVVVTAAGLLAGGGAPDAVRLGVSMVALQAGIGATNDLRDAPADSGRKPGKPIPAGLVSPRAALIVAVVAFSAGLGLAVPSGPAGAALAVVVAGIGLAYDLRLKGTAWSWLPFAVGIPLLPVYGWLATGELPPIFLVVVPTAAVAGASLAISNALVDLERDRAAGLGSVALALGARRAWLLHVGLLGLVVAAAVGTAAALGGAPLQVGTVALAGLVPLVGAPLVRSSDPRRRERGWQLEAIGVALLATAWLAGPALGPPVLAGP